MSHCSAKHEDSRPSLVSSNGDKTVTLTVANTDQRVQRNGYKGVISQSVLKKLSANASLSEQLVKEIMSLILATFVILGLNLNS
ncbi:hypothetical protein [Paenibacillus sp. GCM10028914]|uniref:hypothetical protein n=1 Tax=Paenibacillus sp. GCM10028914 TaxID=3273416 RepID=UPI0036D230ED